MKCYKCSEEAEVICIGWVTRKLYQACRDCSYGVIDAYAIYKSDKRWDEYVAKVVIQQLRDTSS